MEMKRNSKGRQAGISFFGLIIVMVVLALGGILAAQIVPSAVEYQAVIKAVERSKDAGNPQQIRTDFEKAAAIDDIKSVSGRDLEITKLNDRHVVKFAYDKQIHMFGPAYLLLKYAYQTK